METLKELFGDLEGVLTPLTRPAEKVGVITHILEGVGKTTRVQQWRMGLLLDEFKQNKGWEYFEQPSLGHWLQVNQDILGISETQGRQYLENTAFYLKARVLVAGSSANKWLDGFKGLGITEGDEFSALMEVNHYNLYNLRRVLVVTPPERVIEHLLASSQIENRSQMADYRRQWLGVDIPLDRPPKRSWELFGSATELEKALQDVWEPNRTYKLRLEVCNE